MPINNVQSHEKKSHITITLALLLTQFACQKEYLNPSTISQPQAVSSSDGLMTLCNGLQYRYTTNGALSILYNATAGAGLTTRELNVLNVGDIEEANPAVGGDVNNGNGVVRNIWTQTQLIRASADLMLANANVANSDPGVKSGIVGYASIFRALSLGTLAQFFEQAPHYLGHQCAVCAALAGIAGSTLEAAATQVNAAAASAGFTSKVVNGVSVANAIQALIARYSLLSVTTIRRLRPLKKPA